VRKFTLTRRKVVDEIITKFLTDKFRFANSKLSFSFALFWQWQLLLCCQIRVLSFEHRHYNKTKTLHFTHITILFLNWFLWDYVHDVTLSTPWPCVTP